MNSIKAYKLKNNMLNFRYLALLITTLLLSYSQINSSKELIILCVIIFTIIIVSGNIMDDFYSYIAMIPFFTIYKVGDYSVGFIFIFISIIKIIIYNKDLRFKNLSFSILYFTSTIFLNDIFHVSFGILLLPLSLCIYLICFVRFANFSNYNHNKAITIFLISLIISQATSFIISGADLTSLVAQSELSFRLGQGNIEEGQGNNLGGAMGFPIYTMLILGLLTTIIIKKKIKLSYKLLAISFMIVDFIITFFTISRVYFIGIAVFTIFIIIHYTRNNFQKLIPISVLVGFIVIYFFNSEYSNSIFEKYNQRSFDTEYGFTTGRSEIYEQSIDYLISTPKALLIGEGPRGYKIVGNDKNLDFKMSAHNLYIDSLMSFGIIGTFCLFYIFFIYKTKCKMIFNTSYSALSVMPLACYLSMQMTGGSMSDYKTYIYLLFLILNVYAFGDPITKNKSN